MSVPLRHQLTEQTRLQVNARPAGPVHLRHAKRREIEAGAALIEARRDYWLARVRLDQLVSGRMTDLNENNPAPGASPSATSGGADDGGH